MNIKLVLVWIIGIILFLSIGIFGYVNRDLLVKTTDDSYTPIQTTINKRTCTKINDTFTSTYTFYFNDAEEIDRVNIKYVQSTINEVAYSSATTISNMTIKGITSSLSGMASNFTFTMNVDLNNYDKTTLNSLNNDLINLSIVINNIKDYNSYKSALNNLDVNLAYNCN